MKSPAIMGISEEERRTHLQSVTSTEEHTDLYKSLKELGLNRQELAAADIITPAALFKLHFT